MYLRKGDLNFVIPYTNIACPLFQQRLHLNMFQTLYSSVEKEITTAAICMDQTVFGRQVVDEEIRETAAKRFGLMSGFSKLKDIKMTIQVRYGDKYKYWYLIMACQCFVFKLYIHAYMLFNNILNGACNQHVDFMINDLCII